MFDAGFGAPRAGFGRFRAGFRRFHAGFRGPHRAGRQQSGIRAATDRPCRAEDRRNRERGANRDAEIIDCILQDSVAKVNEYPGWRQSYDAAASER